MSTRPQQLAMMIASGTVQYRKKFGHDWKYTGAVVHRMGATYFLIVDGNTYFLNTFSLAINHLTDYIATGAPNHAMCRNGAK
jgi:hypothetical protein